MNTNTRQTKVTRAISAKILAKVAAGMAADEAFDEVFGKGAFKELAGEVYDALKAQREAA